MQAEKLHFDQDLQLGDVIGAGASSVLYRGFRRGQTYAVKVLKTNYVSEAEEGYQLFLKEAAALSRLSHSGLVRVLSVGRSGAAPYLVLEYVEGITLREYLEKNERNEAFIIQVAITLAGALNEVHRFRLLHRDIKPENIMVMPNGAVKLIDFGLVSQMGSKNAEKFAGSLLYSSPEQLGISKLPIDNRSDLYSLGIVLFELLTKRRPYESSSINGLISALATEVLPEVHQLWPQVSQSLSMIVSKLISKDPEDRYQTAEALLLDLQKIPSFESQLKNGGGVFLTVGDRAFTDTPILGRDQEVKLLREAWNKTKMGESQLVFIEGEGGSGKSRLIRELVREAQSDSLLFIFGKCIENDPVPYAPLKAAFHQYLERVRRLPYHQRKEREGRIIEAAKEAGPLILSFSPLLKNLLGGEEIQKHEVSSEPHQKIANFFLRLKDRKENSIFVIDDIQWVDDSTVEVLRVIRKRMVYDSVLVVLASRPFSEEEKKEEIYHWRKDPNARSLTLEYFTPFQGAALIQQLLGGQKMDTSQMTQILSRARGNPFAIGEYVRTMLDSGVLRFSWDHWETDTEKLSALNLDLDIITLIVSRVSKLKGNTRRFMRFCAVLGNKIEATLLPVISDYSEEEIEGLLREAVDANLITPIEGSLFEFSHDRIREALFSEIPQAELPEHHLKIAKALEGKKGSAVYDLAHHYAHSPFEQNAKKIYETNFAAALQALEDHADNEAYQFTQVANKARVSANEPESVPFKLARAEAAGRMRYFAEARTELESVLGRVKDREKRAEVYLKLIALGEVTSNDKRLRVYCHRVFLELENPIGKHPVYRIVTTVWEWLKAFFYQRFPFLFPKVSTEKKRRLTLLAQSYYAVGFAHYVMVDALGWLQLALKCLYTGIRLGASPELVHTYCVYSGALASMFLGKRAQKYLDKASKIAYQIGDRQLIGNFLFWRGGVTSMAGEVTQSEKFMAEAIDKWGPWMDAGDFFYTCGEIGWNLGFRGYATESLRRLESASNRVQQMNEESQKLVRQRPLLLAMQILGHSTLGQYAQAKKKVDEALAMISENANAPFQVGLLSTYIVAFHLEAGELGEELEAVIRHCERVMPMPFLTLFHFRPFFAYVVYVRIAQYQAAKTDSEREEIYKNLLHAIKRFKGAALLAPFRVHLLVGLAAVARINKKYKKALRLLANASQIADAVDSPWAHFEIHRERARVYKEMKKEEAVNLNIKAALSIAQNYHWMGRIQAVRREYDPDKIHPEYSTQGTSTSQPATLEAAKIQRHFDSLLQLTMATASVLDPRQKSVITLDQVIQMLNAERAFLYLFNSNQQLELVSGRNSYKEDTSEEAVSHTVLEEVTKKRKALVFTGREDGELVSTESIRANNLKSIIAAPLTLGDKFMGVLYLDNRMLKGVFTAEDVEILSAIGGQFLVSLESAKAAQLEVERREMAKDLEVIGAVQSLLIPTEKEKITRHWELAGHYQPANQSGGDWWWYDELSDGGILLLVGDVTGHGAGAAMVTATIAGGYRSLGISGQSCEEVAKYMESRLKTLHQTMKGLCQGKFWMMCQALMVDPKNKRIHFWNMGGPPFLSSTDPEKSIFVAGEPLGGSQFTAGHLVKEYIPGTQLCFFTDGTYEMLLPTGKQLGMRGFTKIVENSQALPIEESRKKIVEALDQKRNGCSLADDLAFILLRIH